MPRVRRGWRVFIFYSCGGAVDGIGLRGSLPICCGGRGGRFPAWCCLCLFIVLFLLIAVGCMHGVFGFVLRLTGDRRLTRLKDYRSQSIKGASTALVFPIHNEEVAARLRRPARHLRIPAKNRPT